MDQLRSECFAALTAENGCERQLGKDVAEVFSNERDQSNVEFFPSVTRLLDKLAQEYKLAIVTNGAQDAQQQKSRLFLLTDGSRLFSSQDTTRHRSPIRNRLTV